MRKLALVFVLVCAFALAACGESSVAATPDDTTAPVPTTAPTAPAATATTGGSASAATITMGQFSFVNNTVTIKAGQSVTFNDPEADGGVHNLVTGSAGHFTAATGAPSEFASSGGVNFSPGDTMTIMFPTAGTFSITCTIHPACTSPSMSRRNIEPRVTLCDVALTPSHIGEGSLLSLSTFQSSYTFLLNHMATDVRNGE